MARTGARAATVALAGVGGVVAAHTIGFVIAIPDARARARELTATGHGYWSIAVVVAVIATSAALVGAFGVGRRDASRPRHREHRVAQWVALATWQVLAFTVMEITERIDAGEPLRALVDERAFRVGLVLQLAVAAVAIAVLAVAETAGAASVASGTRRATVVLTTPRRATTSTPRRDLFVGLRNDARAPPRCATP